MGKDRLRIDKDTKLFFSVSSRPGNFGATLYNAAFQEMGINAIYKPLGCLDEEEFEEIINFCITWAEGLSVSMPFKKLAMKYCYIPRETGKIKNGNTIDCGAMPTIYNTDCVGFEKAKEKLNINIENAVIYGNGAMSDSVAHVLKPALILKVGRQAEVNVSGEPDLLINATPVGMPGIEDDIFTEETVKKFKYVADVVVSKEPTNLIRLAEKLGKPFIKGWEISLEQLCEQYKIYINQEAPRDLFEKLLKENGYV